MSSLTVRQVAERFQVSTDTVLRWVRRYGLPAHRVGPRTTRFEAHEVEAWWAGRNTQAPSQTGKRTRVAPAPVGGPCPHPRAHELLDLLK